MPSAQELLAARARRISLLRQRVIAVVLASFALAWGAVVWDGSTGATTTATAQTTTDSTTSSSSDDDMTSSDDGAALSTGRS